MPIDGSRDLRHAVARDVGRCLGRWLHVDIDIQVDQTDPSILCATWPGGSARLPLTPHVWSVEAWRPVTAGILGTLTPDGSANADSSDVARRLLEPTTPTLVVIDATLGDAIARNPHTARSHEEAALLAGVFAYREAAQAWTDTRDGLCRATAHLAVARAMGGGNGHAGRVAEALIETLAGRELAAESLVAGWPLDDPIFAAWGRAIHLRATANWVDLKPAADATLVERYAYARALADRRNAQAVLLWVAESKQPNSVDWGRIASSSHQVSVEAGHVCALGGLAEEAAEQHEVLGQVLGHPPQDGDLARLCGQQESDAEPHRVLSPPIWARYLARHLLGRLYAAHSFAADVWVEPSAAAEVRDYAGRVAVGLPMLPVLRCLWKQDSERIAMAHVTAKVIVENPGMLPPNAFRFAMDALREQGAQPAFPADRWLSGGVSIPGTTWGAEGFTWLQRCLGANILPAVQDGLALAPHHVSLAAWAVHILGEGGRIGEAKPIIERMQGMDARVILTALQFATGDERLVMLRQRANLNPNSWSDLGKALVEANRPVEAAEAYEQAYRLGEDRVAVANQMAWWVGWLLDHGQHDQAHDVAAHGRDVFSFSGLQTWMTFCERTGDFDAAERAAEDILGRYQDDAPLLGLLTRMGPTRPASRAKIDAIVAQRFPRGLVPWNEPPPAEGPTVGVRIATTSAELRRWQLSKGDIIVAVDGTRCDTEQQFLLLRAMGTGPMRLVVWRGSAYQSMSADPPRRRFGVDLADYSTGAPGSSPP